MKNQVIDILEDINPGVDHEARVDLVDSRCIDSLTMIAFVAELEDAFDVEIPPVEIVPDNFNSVEAVCSPDGAPASRAGLACANRSSRESF